jgi:hypothetical protein
MHHADHAITHHAASVALAGRFSDWQKQSNESVRLAVVSSWRALPAALPQPCNHRRIIECRRMNRIVIERRDRPLASLFRH